MFRILVLSVVSLFCLWGHASVIILSPVKKENEKNKINSGVVPTTLSNSIRRQERPENEVAALSINALKGDVEAMLALGHYYYLNQELPQARTLALRWWKKAAEAGDARAMAAFGYLISGIAGGRRDFNEARQWLRRAQLLGLVRAVYLSALVERSISGAKQIALARSLLQQAAQAGDAYAMNDLGVELELEGKVSAAAALYDSAEQAGIPQARQNLRRIQANRIGQETGVLQRLRTLAEEGNSHALLELAERYHLGVGVQIDYAKAIFYYQRAADAGSQKAREFLALLLNPSNDGSTSTQGKNNDIARMSEMASRIQSAALWSTARSGIRMPDRPLRIEDPLADLIVPSAGDYPRR